MCINESFIYMWTEYTFRLQNMKKMVILQCRIGKHDVLLTKTFRIHLFDEKDNAKRSKLSEKY